jgi:cytochrome P450
MAADDAPALDFRRASLLDAGPPLRLAPPAPRPPDRDLPLLRMMLLLRANSLAAWPARAYRELVVHRQFLGVDSWLINDPVGVRRVLGEQADNYRRPVAMQRLLNPFIGGGLLNAEGEDRRRQRRTIAPIFTPASIERLFPQFLAAGEQMIGELGQGGRIDLGRRLERTAIDAAGRALFSLPLADRADEIGGLLRRYFRGAVRPTIADFYARSGSDHGWAQAGRRAWSRRWFAEIEALVGRRRAQPSAPGAPDAFDRLADAATSDKDLRDQAATLIATGFESTARSLFWAAYMLSLDPAEQAAVRAELALAPPEQAKTLDDLRAWPRLTNVVHETLRLYPSVSTLMRVAGEDGALCGHRIKAGSFVVISPWVMHRHHAFWDRPELFMPERFEGRPERLRDGTYLPFGGGRRVCIGGAFAIAEITLILAQLLSRFDLALDDPRPVSPVATATTVPSLEPWFRLTPA